ncbi:MAG: hypoxanthine phosphoribosyltransferase [Carboxydocellales bacterium]
MIAEAERIMFSQEAIAAKVRELGTEISRDYKGEEILVVGILKGAAIFMSDLVRSIAYPVAFDFMAVSSYGVSTESSGVVRIIKDLDRSIEGKHVLIVEDVVDTGLTLNYLVENLKSRNPASLKLCSLLDKPSRRKVKVKADYLGFEIPDEFVVGYGLDYAEHFRNLPYIAVLKKEVYQK